MAVGLHPTLNVFFVPVLLVLGWSLRKVSALASFPLFSSSPWLSLLLVSPFHSPQETETLWQVLTGKLEFGPFKFQQKPSSVTSGLSHPFPQILPRSKTHPTRQMFPLNLGMSAKPLRKGLQMKSKLSCLLPLTNRKKKINSPNKQQNNKECDHLGTIRYLLFLLIKSIWTAVASRNMCVGAGIPVVKWWFLTPKPSLPCFCEFNCANHWPLGSIRLWGYHECCTADAQKNIKH